MLAKEPDEGKEKNHESPVPGKTPGQFEKPVESTLLEEEALDNPRDRSVTPVEPQCRKCGQTFASEAELLEHAKTCKGGQERGPHPHFH